MKPKYDNAFFDIEVQWSEPILYENFTEAHPLNRVAKLYMITARYNKGNSKQLYIGKTWRQDIRTRLSQPDHKRRYSEYKNKKYKNHEIEVRLGVVIGKDCKIVERRIADVENLLIYVSDNPEFENIKAIIKHGVVKSYKILNTGKPCSLPKRIAYGLFATPSR